MNTEVISRKKPNVCRRKGHILFQNDGFKKGKMKKGLPKIILWNAGFGYAGGGRTAAGSLAQTD